MATEVKLPDLGEGVADATISRWRVAAGDTVKAGDVILEVATDKVDTEVVAPADGVMLKLNFGEGELAPADSVVAVIGEAGGEAGESAPAEPEAKAKPEAKTTPKAEAEPEAQPEAKAKARAKPKAEEKTKAEAEPERTAAADGESPAKASPVARRVAADKGVDLDVVAGTGPGGRITKGDVLASAGGKEQAAPATAALPGDLADVPALSVQRLAADNNIDLAEIAEGRPLSSLTRYDVMSAIASREEGKEVAVEPAFATPGSPLGAAPGADSQQHDGKAAAAPAPAAPAKPAEAPKPAPAPAEIRPGEELVKHSRMRAAVARNTVASLFTAPHVTTMWDVNMAAVLTHRQAHKNEFAAAGVNLTITAYFVQAIIAGLKAVPAANATWTDEGVIIKRTYNIGMAVALSADAYGMGGLIVPVIKNAGDLNLQGIARAVNDLADKARKNQLKPDDLADGTFTLSNYGTSGSRFQTPVIVQPQVGILGVGAIEKRAVVVSQGHPLEANTGDYLAFLPMTTLGFSYDHRVLDGATADVFCAAVKQALETVQ
jgi:2-oxoglutarate dehydrogenase E2 component (dihydrolipoamide succinyltransferase)